MAVARGEPGSPAEPPEEDSKKLVAFLEGFSMQAGTHVHERDREGLEHLLRYALRPPLSLESLSRASDGRVVLSLRRPLFDGTTAAAFTPTQLLKRLPGGKHLGGTEGLYRSDDIGANWTRINDDAHQYGGIGRIIADNVTYGRVYVSGGGRGILYNE